MDIQSILRRRQLGLAAGATLVAGLVLAGPAQAATPSASVEDGTLTILGTGGDDAISVALDAADPKTLSVHFGDGTPSQQFDRTTFDSIAVVLRDGDDQFRVVPGGGTLADESLRVAGGQGNDSLGGGDGDDRLSGGSGDDDVQGAGGIDVIFGNGGRDLVNGNAGNDTEFLGNGKDEALWNPGEGSDVVSGGSDIDTLTFNGSNGDETMSLSADGTDAVFLRDPGLIRMDMDHVERLDLATLSGVDTVTVNDLARTDLRLADIDLSALGAGDRLVDVVTVNGTGEADEVDVDADNGAVDVAGLPAQIRITGSETTDHLFVNSLEGDDDVDVSLAAAALISIFVDLGAGQG